MAEPDGEHRHDAQDPTGAHRHYHLEVAVAALADVIRELLLMLAPTTSPQARVKVEQRIHRMLDEVDREAGVPATPAKRFGSHLRD